MTSQYNQKGYIKCVFELNIDAGVGGKAFPIAVAVVGGGPVVLQRYYIPLQAASEHHFFPCPYRCVAQDCCFNNSVHSIRITFWS